jgi:probable HAF family extracellular repeat protein
VAYVSIELGTLPGDTTSTAVGINQLGQVVGVSMNGNASHAFIYADGVMKALPALPDHPFDTASSINDYGQTVGVAYHVPAGPDLDAHGFIYANGVISDIGSLTGTNGSSVAASVNNSGQVTGTSSAPGGGEYAFIYSNGIMTSLGTLPGDSNSIGAAVNASGGVTGGSANGAHEQAFIYINGVMTAIGPGNLNSVGTAISASGQIAGYLWKCCYTAHAFLYSSGIFADLGTLPGDMDSYAEGMNDAGQVTGHSDSSTASRAFLYSNSVMMDLNSLINPGLGITLTDAGDRRDRYRCRRSPASLSAHARAGALNFSVARGRAVRAGAKAHLRRSLSSVACPSALLSGGVSLLHLLAHELEVLACGVRGIFSSVIHVN